MPSVIYDLIAANQRERCCRGEGPPEGGKPVQAERQARERRRRLRIRRPQDAWAQRLIKGRFNLLQIIKKQKKFEAFPPRRTLPTSWE